MMLQTESPSKISLKSKDAWTLFPLLNDGCADLKICSNQHSELSHRCFKKKIKSMLKIITVCFPFSTEISCFSRNSILLGTILQWWLWCDWCSTWDRVWSLSGNKVTVLSLSQVVVLCWDWLQNRRSLQISANEVL